MRKILYCKYNQNRNPKFQTKTVIYRTEKEKYIEKEALCEEAAAHIKTFQKNYEMVREIYPAIEFITCEMKDGIIRYPFIEGQYIDDFLQENVTSWEELFSQMKELISHLFQVNPEKICKFEMTKEFERIFGRIDCSSDICLTPCNLDMIFDNLMITEDGKVKAFDYEWVCNFPVPEKYVIYRVLCRFYDKYFGYISPKYSFEEYIGQFDFNEDEQKRYRQMEDAFIRFIYKDGEPAFQGEQYFLKRTTFDEISVIQDNYKSTKEELEHAVQDYNKAMEVLHNTEKEYLTTIDRLNDAVKMKEDVEAVLHNTEKEYLATIDRLNDAVKIKEDVEVLLHNTEREYLTTIGRLNDAVKIKEDVEALLHNTEEALHNTEMERDSLNTQLNLVVNSISWKITKPLRWIKKGCKSLKNDGIRGTVHKVEKKFRHLSETDTPIEQKEVSEPKKNIFGAEVEVTEEELKKQKNFKFEKVPKISIITPVFNTPKNFLQAMIESVINQTYQNWELCLVNFSNADFEAIDEICKKYAQKDDRIVYHVEKENKGISENTNICIAYSTGEYIALLDHDDVLHPCALFEAVKAINEDGCDFLYTDEIKFEGNLENLFSPNYKPDFSMDELRAHNYICHFNVYKKSLFDEVGGYREEFDGSQDHDIVLRLTEKAKKIVHIPRILYYWRVHSNSVAQNIEAKSYATDAGENAVTEQLERAGETGQYAESIINHIPLYRIRTNIEMKPDVTVIIWGGDSEEQIQKTKDSLNKWDYRIVEDDGKSLGERWNLAMKQVGTKYALFLRAGLQISTENSVNEFMIYAHRNDIATIDCKVLTNQNTIFSGGVYLSGDKGMPIKVRCMGGRKDYPGYENGMLHSREVVAATGLCTFVDVETWKTSNGFSNTDNEYVMLEYSYQMWRNGKRNIWTPFIEAFGMGESEQGQYVKALTLLSGEEYDEKDPYFNNKIIDLRLE